MPVREDRQNDLYFFRVNIRFVIMLLFSIPSARESRRDFLSLCQNDLVMGRSCYVIKNEEGGVDNVLAPNNQPSGLYQRAMEVLGDQKQALSVWGTAYSTDFVSFFGDWMSMPSEYDLDSNGEPRYDDVMSFIKQKNYAVGNFMADEVKDINNTITSLGVDNINDLNDMIVSNFLSGGDIFINRYNLERSGMYDADEIDNIMTNRLEYERVRDMMRRIVDFMSEGDLNEKDTYFLSSESDLGDDYMIYEDAYDSLGKRRVLNPMEVRDTIMRAVGGISDRREFDQAFASVPYPSLALRYQEDQDYADRMYDTYRNMTRMEVRDQEGNTITDSYSNSTIPYISMPKDMKGLRDKVGEMINMDDFKDIKDVAGRLYDIAMDLSDMGVDISEAISDEMVISRPEDIRDLMASLDVMLSSIQNGDPVYDDFISDLDRITGKGNPIYEVQDTYFTGDRMVYVRSGKTSLSDMYDRNMLYVGRNTYHNTTPITDTDQAYEVLADIGIAQPSYLPTGVVPQGASRSDIGVVKDNIKKLVMDNISSSNTESMILARLIYQHPVTSKVDDVDIDREFRRYEARQGKDRDFIKSCISLRKIQIKERLKKSDLYNNVLRFLDFNGFYNVSLNHHDRGTLKNIEMSLPEGQVRDLLFDVAIESSDSSMRDLFYLDRQDRMMDVGFYRYLYQRNPGLLREVNGGVEARPDGLFLARGRYDDFVSFQSGLYEKVGETVNGGIYSFVDNFIYSDPSSYQDSMVRKIGDVTVRSDDNRLSRVEDNPSSSKIINEYTANTNKLMRDFSCN